MTALKLVQGNFLLSKGPLGDIVIRAKWVVTGLIILVIFLVHPARRLTRRISSPSLAGIFVLLPAGCVCSLFGLGSASRGDV